jgi:hypothetical protein
MKNGVNRCDTNMKGLERERERERKKRGASEHPAG